MSLAEANSIYTRGIQLAKTKGHVESRMPERVFRISLYPNEYILITHSYLQKELFNQFTVVDQWKNRRMAMIDRQADGILVAFDDGSNNLDEYQELYNMVLKRGINEGAIAKENGHYVVKKTR